MNFFSFISEPLVSGRSAALAVLSLGACGAMAGEEGLRWGRLASLPDRVGVAGAFAGVSGGALLVGGGAQFPGKPPWEGGSKVWQDRVWVLEGVDGEWREAGRLPRALAYGVAVTVGDSVWCLGGSDAERHYGEGFSLTWKDGKLQAGGDVPPTLPIPLANAAGAVDEAGTVYVAGGSMEPGEQAASNRAFACVAEVGGRRWRELPPLPAEARLLSVGAAQGEAFYLFGGAALELREGKVRRRPLREAWRYRAADGWQRLADLPHACVAAPSPAPVALVRWAPGELARPAAFLLGGDDGSRAAGLPPSQHPGFPPNSLRYDFAADQWREAGGVAAPRATVPCVWWEGRFVFPSGEVRPGVRSAEVWTLSILAGEEKGKP